jgi:hypothetical protein
MNWIARWHSFRITLAGVPFCLRLLRHRCQDKIDVRLYLILRQPYLQSCAPGRGAYRASPAGSLGNIEPADLFMNPPSFGVLLKAVRMRDPLPRMQTPLLTVRFCVPTVTAP